MMIEFADNETVPQLKQIIAELRTVQNVLQHPEDQFYALTKEIISARGSSASQYERTRGSRKLSGVRGETGQAERFIDGVHYFIMT